LTVTVRNPYIFVGVPVTITYVTHYEMENCLFFVRVDALLFALMNHLLLLAVSALFLAIIDGCRVNGGSLVRVTTTTTLLAHLLHLDSPGTKDPRSM
jgi:hypothetical protein